MEKFLTNYKPRPNIDPNTNLDSKNIPWVEKYRPKSMDDIVYQNEVVSSLKKSINGSDFPNFLFYGPPGTGKTTTILAAAKEIFGPTYYRSRVLELNASDERGIAVVREKIKNFSRTTASESMNGIDGRKIPAFKLIILDEADSMTATAQAALRRTMEVECKTTRFCLICNYVTRIIDPLTSRCLKFRFKSLDRDVALGRLMNICQLENITASKEVMMYLIKLCEGDLRRSITMLQTASLLVDNSDINDKIITEVAGVVPANLMDEYIQALTSKSFYKVKSIVNKILDSGYALRQIITQMHSLIFNMDVDYSVKAVFLEKISICDENLNVGGDEYENFMSISCSMMEHLSKI